VEIESWHSANTKMSSGDIFTLLLTNHCLVLAFEE